MTREAVIEDDSAFLKVPEDEISPVRQAPKDPAAIAAEGSAQAAKVTGSAQPTLTAPTAAAPRQIPGLAFRAAQGKATDAKKADSEKETP